MTQTTIQTKKHRWSTQGPPLYLYSYHCKKHPARRSLHQTSMNLTNTIVEAALKN